MRKSKKFSTRIAEKLIPLTAVALALLWSLLVLGFVIVAILVGLNHLGVI